MVAKVGIDIKNSFGILKDKKWSLCIGAGTSIPIVPSWNDLVLNLISKKIMLDERLDSVSLKELGFSPDSMLQAIKNKLGIKDEDFAKMLSDEIYSSIRSGNNREDWEAYCKISDISNISGVTEATWKKFENLYNKSLVCSTSNQLARAIISSIIIEQYPQTILTFNAEDIFYSLLNYHYFKVNISKKRRFKKIINSINSYDANLIPIIHCHGIIPPIQSAKKGKIANEKLVFSEIEYQQIANSSFSWQSSVFINTCMNNVVVFIGVSFTDSNMRRWLSLLHMNKVKEFSDNHIEYKVSTQHYWINKKTNYNTMRWYESLVEHLGVRLIWIDDWNEVKLTLENLIGYK